MAALQFKDRKEAHLASRLKMREGQFQQAVEQLLACHIHFGSHVLMMVDIASCYYMLQDYLNYKLWTVRTLEQYQRINHQLSEDSRQSVSLALGKLLEELGQIVPALELYENLNNYQLPTRFVLKTQAQMLRLYCLTGDREKISEVYFALSMAKKEDSSCQFDHEHALLHAELFLYDFEVGFQRIQRVFSNSQIPGFEKRLIYFDFLFECLRTKNLNEVWFQNIVHFNYTDCDAFEQIVWDMCWSEMGKTPKQPVDLFRAEGLSPLCALRVLLLMQSRSSSVGEAQTIRRKFLLLSQQMDPRSRQIIRSNWGLDEADVELKWDGEILSYQQNTLLLGQQEVTRQFVELFSRQNEIVTEILIFDVFQLPLDNSTYGRLKTLVSRLNKSIEGLCGVSACFSVSKNFVKLNSKVHLKRVS